MDSIERLSISLDTRFSILIIHVFWGKVSHFVNIFLLIDFELIWFERNKMKTRSRKSSNSTVPVDDDVPTLVPVQSKKKAPQKQSTDALVASIINSIKDEKSAEKPENGEDKSVTAAKKVTPKQIRGIPKSGRPWKEPKKKWVKNVDDQLDCISSQSWLLIANNGKNIEHFRFSTIKKSIYRRTFEKKEKLREELKHIKELSKSIKEDKKLEKVQLKERREENAKRRLENERKNEIVQVIKNPAKLKRMKKKQLRKIEKRDLAAGNGPKVV